MINADETPVRVLDPTRDSTRKGYFWVYIGDDGHPYTVFDYRDSRSRDGPAEILKDFRGYLQTDAYASYESVVLESAGRIIPVGCWAHARREFFDARLNQPREVHHVLGLIAQLYDIEDEIRLCKSGRAAGGASKAKRADSRPPGGVLARAASGALPKSQYGKAIAYALNHWTELRRFTESGILEIDNNIAERTLRLCAIGRKNWMFLGSDRGGETAAICFSILAGAKRHRIEPFAYVRDLLIALSSDKVDLNSLLPDVWIAAHPEHVLDVPSRRGRSRRQRTATPSCYSPREGQGGEPGLLRLARGRSGSPHLAAFLRVRRRPGSTGLADRSHPTKLSSRCRRRVVSPSVRATAACSVDQSPGTGSPVAAKGRAIMPAACRPWVAYMIPFRAIRSRPPLVVAGPDVGLARAGVWLRRTVTAKVITSG